MDIAQAVSFHGRYPSDQPRIQASELKRSEDYNWTKDIQEYAKDIGRWMLLNFSKVQYLQEETSFYIRNCAKKQAKV